MKRSSIQSKSNSKNKSGLAFKLTSYITLGVVIVFLILIFTIAVTIKNDLVKREQEKLVMLAKENATIARDFMETMLDKQEILMRSINTMGKIAGNGKIEMVTQLISDTQGAQTDVLSLFVVTEPNTIFENTPQGYSIYATSNKTTSSANMFENVKQSIYDEIKTNKQVVIVDPFKKTIEGKEYTIIAIAMPILGDNGEFLGVIGSNIDTSVLNNAAYNDGGFESFVNQIVCAHQTVIINTLNPEFIGKKFADVTTSTNKDLILASTKDTEPLNLLDTNNDGTRSYRSYIPFRVGSSSMYWLTGTSIDKQEFDKGIVKQLMGIVLTGILALVVLSIIVYVLIKRRLKPIGELDNAARQLAEGNLNINIDFHSNDELGSLADSLRNSVATLGSYVSDIDKAMGEMAKGNFDVLPSQPFIGDFKGIEDSITKFLFGMTATLTEIGRAADQVSMGSGQVSEGSQALAQGTSEQAEAVSNLADSITLISSQVTKNASSAEEVNLQVASVGDNLSQSNDRMQEMIKAMDEINNTSQQISKVIKTIEDIAFQTNILALNAAVEAARAGEAGKGFAVVADEVRNLASKSADAAMSTTALIEGSIKAVNEGGRIVGSTADSLLLVVDGAKSIQETVSKIAHASTEQALAVTDITASIEQISAVVRTNSATSEESAAASEELSGQARMLNTLVGRFKLKK